MVKTQKKDITEAESFADRSANKSVTSREQIDNTIELSSLSKGLQDFLREEIKQQFFCPKCGERFSEQNQFNNCVSDPQDYEEYDHCFSCGYDSREEKEKEEVPF